MAYVVALGPPCPQVAHGGLPFAVVRNILWPWRAVDKIRGRFSVQPVEAVDLALHDIVHVVIEPKVEHAPDARPDIVIKRVVLTVAIIVQHVHEPLNSVQCNLFKGLFPLFLCKLHPGPAILNPEPMRREHGRAPQVLLCSLPGINVPNLHHISPMSQSSPISSRTFWSSGLSA